MSGRLESLTAFERELLAVLPTEPVGLLLADLADGLLDNTGPQARGQVKAALDAVDRLLGGLCVGRGDDDLGHADVELYGVKRDDRSLVNEFSATGCLERPPISGP